MLCERTIITLHLILLVLVSALPHVLISFEERHNETAINYTRGRDEDGNSLMILRHGANVGESRERTGNVLSLNGFDASAVIGNFPSTPIKYVSLSVV